MAAVVDGLGDRLGPDASVLRDALAQIRLAFVSAQDLTRRSLTEPGDDDHGFVAPLVPRAHVELTGAPAAIVRVPSAIWVQWKELGPVVGGHRAEPGRARRTG